MKHELKTWKEKRMLIANGIVLLLAANAMSEDSNYSTEVKSWIFWFVLMFGLGNFALFVKALIAEYKSKKMAKH